MLVCLGQRICIIMYCHFASCPPKEINDYGPFLPLGWNPDLWFTSELGDLKKAGRHLERHWWGICTDSDRPCYRAHSKTYEAITVAKKWYFSATVAPASSKLSHLFKVIRHLMTPKMSLHCIRTWQLVVTLLQSFLLIKYQEYTLNQML